MTDQLEPASAEETTFGTLLAATSEIKSFDLSEMLAPVTHAIERLHHDIIGDTKTLTLKLSSEDLLAALNRVTVPLTQIVPSPIGVEF